MGPDGGTEAEGKAREHKREYLHHISSAQGSLAELETQIEIAGRLGYCSPNEVGELGDQSAALGRQLSALRTAFERTLPPNSQELTANTR